MMLTKSLTAATAAVSCAAAKRVCQLHHGYRAAATTQHNTAYLGGSIVGSPAVASPSITRRLYSSRLIVACSSDSTTVELEVRVEGMKCGGCSSRVEAALRAMDHVKGVQVDLDTKLATVEVEAPNLIDAMNMLPNFVKAIKELGFEAEPHIEYQA